MANTKAHVARTKNQVVFFRLTTEEYEAVVRASETAEVNLSSFVRFAVLFWLETHHNDGSKPEDDIKALRAKFVDFETEFRQFVRKQVKEKPPNPQIMDKTPTAAAQTEIGSPDRPGEPPRPSQTVRNR